MFGDSSLVKYCRGMDYVTRLRQQWAERAPELDTSVADVVARISRIAAIVGRLHDEGLAARGLTRPEFELLTALRRAGRPMRAREVGTVTESPGATLTKRLDHLHAAGLVSREVPDRDRRGVLVGLTEQGRALVDQVFPEQLARERLAVARLSGDERAVLAGLLGTVLETLEPLPAASGKLPAARP